MIVNIQEEYTLICCLCLHNKDLIVGDYMLVIILLISLNQCHSFLCMRMCVFIFFQTEICGSLALISMYLNIINCGKNKVPISYCIKRLPIVVKATSK